MILWSWCYYYCFRCIRKHNLRIAKFRLKQCRTIVRSNTFCFSKVGFTILFLAFACKTFLMSSFVLHYSVHIKFNFIISWQFALKTKENCCPGVYSTFKFNHILFTHRRENVYCIMLHTCNAIQIGGSTNLPWSCWWGTWSQYFVSRVQKPPFDVYQLSWDDCVLNKMLQ